jgi:predicted Rossmann fold flavoprotein
MRDSVDVAVVGAGAAGFAAAIGAARRGASVALLERLPRPGKKLLATGGGRCNILNDRLTAGDYTATDLGLVAAVLGRQGRAGIGAFFEGLGLRLQSDEAGRVYPVTNQAASVLKVLEHETARLGAAVETGFAVDRIAPRGGRFQIRAADGRTVEARTAVLAAGGKSYPALGSDGSGYALAASFGHRVVPPVPSAVPLVVKVRTGHFLTGQRMRVRAESRIGGRPTQRAEGEILFTPYGLSGPAILDVSESVSIAINRDGRKDVAVVIDFLPFLSAEAAADEFARRLEAGWAPRDLTSGLLPEKFCLFLPQVYRDLGLAPGREKSADTAVRLTALLKAREYPVDGTRGWNEAEFTAGGVDAREVEPVTLESRKQRGLYLAGEVLDVQGGRGGFNLAWAWASGLVAGHEAAGGSARGGR